MPKLLAYGTTCSGTVTYLATRLVRGYHPSRVCPVPPAEAEAAQAGLRAVHNAGVPHGDIRADNLMLRRPNREGAPPAAMLLDFGFAKHVRDPAEREVEMQQLRRMLRAPENHRTPV